MTTIASLEDDGLDDDNGLVTHLKDPDFFDVQKFPTAKLVITDTRYKDPTHLTLLADLTIKGIALPIQFEAEVNFKKQLMRCAFSVDRTRWGIIYESQQFSIQLKDKAISNTMDFEVVVRL